MALKTQSKTVVGSLGHHQITMTVNEDSTNTTNNTSSISYTITLGHAGTYYGFWWNFSNSDPITITYTIDGVTNTCTLRSYQTNSTVTVKTGTQTINHNSNGAKSLSWSFSFTSQSGYSYLPGSGSSGTQSLTLTTIPRETTFGSKTPSSCTLKNSMTIYFDRKSDSYKHRLYYKIGSNSEKEITSSAITDSSKSWTPDIGLASNNKTGTSISCTLTIRTYNGTTQIGSDITKAITLNIPNDNDTKPTISIAVSDAKSYSGTYGGYVQSKSSIKTVVTAGKKDSTYGADISSYSVVYRQNNASGSVLASGTSSTFSWTPTQSGTIHITATVTDKRGFSRSTTSTATVVAYANPTFASCSVRRYPDETDTTPSDIGGYARATYSANYSSLSNNNTLSVIVKYKEHSATSYVALLNGGTSASATTDAFEANVAKVYDVRIILKDNFNTSEDIYKDLSLSTASSFMHWPVGGNGIAFGKMAETYDAIEVGYSWIYMKKNGQPSFVMHRTDYDTQGRFYLTSDEDPWFRFQFKHAGDTDWRDGLLMSEGYLAPSSQESMSLGLTSSRQWSSVYSKNFFENGVLLENKYAPKASAVANESNLGWTGGTTVASGGDWKNLGSYTFDAGSYLIFTRLRIAGNANGTRRFMWATTSGGTSAWRYNSYESVPGCAGWTNCQSVFFAVASANETRYLNFFQDSGTALAVYVSVQILKIA